MTVVPLLDSAEPDWFRGFEFSLEIENKWKLAWRTFQAGRRKGSFESTLQAFTSGLAMIEPRILPFSLRHSVMCERARLLLPDADITIATSFETALPVRLHGRGVLAYYAQHFEPYFKNEFDDPSFAEAAARSSYLMPLKIIANSAWLGGTISNETGARVHAVAGNAIDEAMFNEGIPCAPEKPLRVISYGGRGAVWKGFDDMAEGVRRARAQGVEIEWSVYGDCALKPENSIAPFKHLGFLGPEQLAAAYRQSHVLLSASWYESFPLFPLEAMASGLAVITTQPGTEAFAEHMRTAWVVPPKDPDALSGALVGLARDRDLRSALGVAAMQEAKRHSWENAASQMECILLNLL
ncbi:glycosyltransferase family 4 protein [Thermomonas fusca]